MEEKSISRGLHLIWEGLKMFTVCGMRLCWKSSTTAIVDMATGIVIHPILSLIVIGVVCFQFVTIAKQRVERDASSKKEYQLEQSLDSAKVMSEIATFKYEHADSIRRLCR